MTAQDPNANERSSTNILWGIAGIFIVGFLVWYFFGDVLKEWFLQVRLWQIQFINYFTGDLNLLESEVAALSGEQLSWPVAAKISEIVGGYLLIPLGIFLALLAVFIYFKSAATRFTKKYDMEKLLIQERKNWPRVAPVSKLNLVEEDIDKGPWAMSQTPMQFCKRHKIIDIELVPDADASWKKEPTAKATLKKDAARRVLARQLGAHWKGIDALPDHTRALFAVFAGRIGRDQKGAETFLDQVSTSAVAGELDFTGVDALLNKHISTKEIAKIMQSHAYVYTVMASMLATARSDGVVPSSSFLWLKPLDRRLWYMLNAVGRQVAVPEAAGPFAHWKTELQMGRPLNSPFVEEAVLGLEKALNEIIYTPDDKELQELMAKQPRRR